MESFPPWPMITGVLAMRDERGDRDAPLAPMAMDSAIGEYVAERRQCGQMSTAASHQYYLRKNADAFGWISTADIPGDVFMRMGDKWPSYTARISQWAMAAFVRWCGKRCVINGSILTYPMTPPSRVRRPKLDREAQEYILFSLKDQPVPAQVDSRRRKARRARPAGHDAARRAALYPIIYVSMRWAIRRLEAVTMRVGDWDAETRVLTVRCSATRAHRSRSFQVDEETTALFNQLTAGRANMDPMFLTMWKKKWTTLHLSRQVRRFMRSIGVKWSLSCCHRCGIERLRNEVARDENDLCAMTGLSHARYARTLAPAWEERALARQRTGVLYREVMSPFYQLQSEKISARVEDEPQVPTVVAEFIAGLQLPAVGQGQAQCFLRPRSSRRSKA